MLLQDCVGPVNKWPKHIRRLFWTKHVRNWDRLLLVTFVYVNGLNPEIFFDWVELMNLCRDRSARRHMEYLFHAFQSGKYQKKYYAWNVAPGNYQYIDGTTRRY